MLWQHAKVLQLVTLPWLARASCVWSKIFQLIVRQFCPHMLALGSALLLRLAYSATWAAGAEMVTLTAPLCDYVNFGSDIVFDINSLELTVLEPVCRYCIFMADPARCSETSSIKIISS